MSTRRKFLTQTASTAILGTLPARAAKPALQLKYLMSSALYGDMKLESILPEIAAGSYGGIDLWCKTHGTQREEVAAMGVAAYTDLLQRFKVQQVCFTNYPLGPFSLKDEMAILKQLGGKLLVAGAKGPKNVSGAEAKAGIATFLEQMKPHADAAGELGLAIAIENHANSLLSTPDSIRCWVEQNHHPALGVAFAPHHLAEQVSEIPQLIKELGAAKLPFFYFQEHGIGSQKKVDKEIELQQLPGYGTLNYKPILQALRDINFQGWAEIFMHPTPRGVPILETASAVTKAINKSRDHLEKLLKEVNV